MMRKYAFLCVATVMTALIGGLVPARAAEKVSIVIPRDSVFVLNYMGARDAGVFATHGIDLTVDPRPFAGFLAALPSKQTMATTYAGTEAIEKINQGVDWVIIGPALTAVQEIFVLKNSPIKTVTDLRGKTLGTFSTGAGSFKATRAAVLDAYGFDLIKDTDTKQLAPPALFKLFQNGTVDAMFNISSLNIAADSEPDKYRVIFAPNEYWIKKTGYPIVWAAPIVAWRSWVEENPKRAADFVAATEDSFRWLRVPENFDVAVKKYGELAGVTKPEEIANYKKWLAAKRMFMTDWDRKAVDAEWKFLDMAKRVGVLDKVPPEKTTALLVENH
jgi:ABC-type nitrate/sulfonate/bicarbonate transport system substrate-binding protein